MAKDEEGHEYPPREQRLLEGLLTAQGRVIHFNNREQLVWGGPQKVSPEYYRFLENVAAYADRYPASDPRTWLPLAKAMVRPDTPEVESVLTADALALAASGEIGTPAGGTAGLLDSWVGTPSAGLDPDQGMQSIDVEDVLDEADDEDDGGWGWVGNVIDTVGDVQGAVLDAGANLAFPWRGIAGAVTGEADGVPGLTSDTFSGDEPQAVTDARADVVTPVRDAIAHVAEPVTGSAPVEWTYGKFKAATRNFFAALQMPQQAIVSTAANIADDASKGDYKSMLLHALGANPINEALFIAAENVTGNEFYRENATEATNWEQTTFGQVIKDLAGQGGEEGLRGLDTSDDPAGFQHMGKQDGFFYNFDNRDVPTVGNEPGDPEQWQSMARKKANTLVPETLVTDENIVPPGAPWEPPPGGTPTALELNEHYKILANSLSLEEANEWARTYGMMWSKEQDGLVYPAQGFTFGRAATGLFVDPHTYQYNTISGLIDGYTNIAWDPITYVPGGIIRKLGQTGIGGGRILKGAAEAVEQVPEMAVQMRGRDVQTLIAQGARAVDVTPAGSRVVLRERGTGKLLMTAAQIDESPLPISKIARLGTLRAEKQIGWTAGRKASDLDEVVRRSPAIRGWLGGDETSKVIADRDLRYALALDRSTGKRRVAATEIEALYPGSRLVLRDHETNKVIAFASEIDESGESVAALSRQGKLRLEKFEFDTTPEIDAAMAGGAADAIKNPWIADTGPGLVGIDAGRGGMYAAEQAMRELTHGKLQDVPKVLAEMDSPYTIMRLLNYKIDLDMAVRLADATNPWEVTSVLAPAIGAELKYFGDFQRLTLHLPAYSRYASLTRNTDLHRLKDYWMSHVAGQSWMPTEFADLRDPMGVVHNVQRLGRVAVTDFDNNPRLLASVDQLMRDMAGGASRSKNQKIYHSYAGAATDEVLLDADGGIVKTRVDIEDEVSALMEEGMSRKAAKNRVLLDTPDAVAYGEHGTDGFLTVLAKVLAEEHGVDPQVAKNITRAWSNADVIYRRLLGAHGASVRGTVNGETIGASFSDADLLENILMFPDARKLRGAISNYGKAIHTIRSSSLDGRDVDRAREVVDEAMSYGVARWKELALLNGGVRFPVYVSKQVGDTAMTVAMSGGASIFHKPMDLLNYIMTSTIRDAMVTSKGEPLRRARAINKIGVLFDSLPRPVRSIVWPGDSIKDLPSGESMSVTLRKIMDGDPSAHDIGGTHVFNIVTGGGRGGQGQDVLYGQAARDLKQVEKGTSTLGRITGSGHLSHTYIEAHADAIYKMSRSEIYRRVASANYSAERTARWFMHHQDESGMTMRELVSSMDRSTAVKLRTENGVHSYLAGIRREIDQITGGNDELLDVIRSRGKMKHLDQETGEIGRIPMLTGNRVTADRKVSRQYGAMLRRLDRDDVTRLPDVLHYWKSDRGQGKNAWMRYHSAMFASAGRWEDLYAREPYYRQKMGEYIDEMADLMLPAERESLAAALERRGSPKLAASLRGKKGVGVLTRRHIEQYAVSMTEKNIAEVAYNAANRREWAYAARFLSPFVQASVNGMYRWAKAAIQNPESTYRIMRYGRFLLSNDSSFISDYTLSGGIQGDPFVYQDPQSGVYMVALPFSGLLMQEAVRVLGGVESPSSPSGIALPVGPLNLATPALADQLAVGEQMGRPFWKSFTVGIFPGVGPFVSAPAGLFANGLGRWEDYLLPFGARSGEAGSDRVLDQFIPGGVTRLLDAWKPSNEQQAASAKRQTFFTLWAAKEYGLDPADPVQFEAAKEIAARMSTTMNWVQALSTYVSPTPGRIVDIYQDPDAIPGQVIALQALSDIYSGYIDANPGDFNKAEAEFLSDMGFAAIAAITPASDSDAPAPVNSVMALLRDDPEAYEHFSPVIDLLNSDKTGLEAEFNPQLYRIQKQSGQVPTDSLDVRLERARQNLLSFAWYQHMAEIENANLSPEEELVEKNALKDSMVAARWRGFDIGTEAERNTRFSLMWEAANTPSMQTIIGTEAAADLRMYLKMRQAAIGQMRDRGLGGDLAQATTQPEREALFLIGENMALGDERFSVIWWRALRGEVAPEAPEEAEE